MIAHLVEEVSDNAVFFLFGQRKDVFVFEKDCRFLGDPDGEGVVLFQDFFAVFLFVPGFFDRPEEAAEGRHRPFPPEYVRKERRRRSC